MAKLSGIEFTNSGRPLLVSEVLLWHLPTAIGIGIMGGKKR
jgi:hypothetical protein